MPTFPSEDERQKNRCAWKQVSPVPATPSFHPTPSHPEDPLGIHLSVCGKQTLLYIKSDIYRPKINSYSWSTMKFFSALGFEEALETTE